MGLDMNLYKKRYVQNWDYMKPKERHEVTVTKGGATVPVKNVAYIVEEVISWRKANAIHSWFVNNVQGGVDDCRTAYVSRENLEELLETTETVLAASKLVPGKVSQGQRANAAGDWEDILENGTVIADSTIAAELLPTESGFFFGNTHYDEYYYYDLERTRDALKTALEDETDNEFEYSSSW